jgi:competence ComEA-like helix-hairpin-helix protein
LKSTFRLGSTKLWCLGAGLTLVILTISNSSANPQKAASDEAEKDKTAFEAVCGKCHPTSMAAGLLSEPEWVETIDVMRGLGAKGTDEQFERVLRHLLRTQTKVNVNTATAEQIAPVLDISYAAAAVLVKHRGEKGAFKTIEDVKKVAGLDPVKLEERKDRIAFR